jgi:hypothetical protein
VPGKRLSMKAALLVILILSIGSIYALTMSRTSSYDALCYYRAVEYGTWNDLGHPHHLIYLPALRVWFGLWRGLGYDGGVVLPSKTLSLIGAHAALVAFWYVLARFFSAREAVPLLLMLSFTYVVWHFASEAEPVTFFLLFSILGVLLLIKLQTSGIISYAGVITLAAVNSLGVLFHQELVVLVPISAIYIALYACRTHRWRAVVIYAGVAALLIGAPYLAAARYFGGAGTLYRRHRQSISWRDRP